MQIASIDTAKFYIWNLGFPDMFPKFSDNGIQFPVTQQMEIELGLIGAVTLMGTAVQLRILKVLQQKVQEIAEETGHFDEDAEVKAAERMSDVNQERDLWEKDHSGIGKHGRNESSISSMPLLNNRESASIPSEVHWDEGRQRNISGLSEFKAAPTSDEDLRRASRHSQVPGVLPTLDLGHRIQEEVPSNYIAKDVKVTTADLENLKRKQELLAEIQTIRRSIDILKTETPVPSSSDHSRRLSLVSGRTDAVHTHSRAPDTRARAHSMELLSLTRTHGVVSRPNSLPLKNDDWDNYIQERKLLQPPSGVTPPIMTTPLPVPRLSVAPAIQEALQLRKRREGVLAGSSESSGDVPLVRFVQQQQKANNAQITILPPRRASTSVVAPIIRTRTFEELNERHREKLRDMQAPLTQVEKEQADLEAAKRRWERAKAVEKEAVARRQAVKAAALEKRKKAGSPEMGGERRSRVISSTSRRHGRSLSADMLGGVGTSGPNSRRLSMMKVEDWQRYQHETEVPGGGGSKQAMRPEGPVPFPHESTLRPAHLRQKSRDNIS